MRRNLRIKFPSEMTNWKYRRFAICIHCSVRGWVVVFMLSINLSALVVYCSQIPTSHSHHSVLIISLKFKGFFQIYILPRSFVITFNLFLPHPASPWPATKHHSMRFPRWLHCERVCENYSTGERRRASTGPASETVRMGNWMYNTFGGCGWW